MAAFISSVVEPFDESIIEAKLNGIFVSKVCVPFFDLKIFTHSMAFVSDFSH